jgi:hypothetical protein
MLVQAGSSVLISKPRMQTVQKHAATTYPTPWAQGFLNCLATSSCGVAALKSALSQMRTVMCVSLNSKEMQLWINFASFALMQMNLKLELFCLSECGEHALTGIRHFTSSQS